MVQPRDVSPRRFRSARLHQEFLRGNAKLAESIEQDRVGHACPSSVDAGRSIQEQPFALRFAVERQCQGGWDEQPLCQVEFAAEAVRGVSNYQSSLQTG